MSAVRPFNEHVLILYILKSGVNYFLLFDYEKIRNMSVMSSFPILIAKFVRDIIHVSLGYLNSSFLMINIFFIHYSTGYVYTV